MALSHAILTLLVEQPHSGYDLTKKFEGTVGYFWKASHQQIYKELAKLEKDGWVSSQVIPQAGRPDKKMYRVTEFGKQQLIQWVMQPTDMMPIREDLLVKTSVSYLVPRDVMIEEIKRHRQLHQERLEVYRDLEKLFFQNVKELAPEWQCRHLSLRRGIRFELEYIDWCEEAIQVLTELPDTGKVPLDCDIFPW
jgi:DNA-binding PadR family transcriptional regulator